jgi:hypothetical protein
MVELWILGVDSEYLLSQEGLSCIVIVKKEGDCVSVAVNGPIA